MIRKVGYTEKHRWHEDVERLQKVMLANGYESSYDSAANLWEELSDDYAAGWLGLPSRDSDLWQIIEHKVEKLANE